MEEYLDCPSCQYFATLASLYGWESWWANASAEHMREGHEPACS